MAPALGLYLGELFFDGYNKKQRQQMQNDLRLAAIRSEKAAKVWPPPTPAAPVVEGACNPYINITVTENVLMNMFLTLFSSCCGFVRPLTEFRHYTSPHAAVKEEEEATEGAAKKARLNPASEGAGGSNSSDEPVAVVTATVVAAKPAAAEKDDEGQVRFLCNVSAVCDC